MTNTVALGADRHEFSGWIGRTEEQHDIASIASLHGLAVTLNHEISIASKSPIPLLWHWLYFHPQAKTAELAPDGHPHKGGFMPPIPKPRRMWAGSQIEFHAPLQPGAPLRRTSSIADISLRQGRSGTLYFVKIRHEVFSNGQLALVEEQDIVYRDAPTVANQPSQPTRPVLDTPAFSREVQPSTPLLFRYSALTFNSHRIHYDRNYATSCEGYSGLVVHGPLLATLMFDMASRECPGRPIRQFSFRAQKPVLDTANFHVCGNWLDKQNASLWITDAAGEKATIGQVCFD